MIRRRSWYFGMVLSMVVISLAPPAAAEERRSRSSRCSSIRVSSADAQPGLARRWRQGRRAPAFSATEVLDLELRVRIPRGKRKLALKVFTPDGHLYQELSVPVVAEETSSSSRRWRRRRYDTVTGTLPVGGTSIVTSSLYGTWSVEAYLDDGDAACTAPRSFVIQP